MAMLRFAAADVRRVVEHSLAAPEQSPVAFSEYLEGKPRAPDGPAVLFVHDDGVYLMSNGKPRDIVEGEHSFVAYACGCNPKVDSDWWDYSRVLVGGDDFGETLPWASEIKELLDLGALAIVLEVSSDNIQLGAEWSRLRA